MFHLFVFIIGWNYYSLINLSLLRIWKYMSKCIYTIVFKLVYRELFFTMLCLLILAVVLYLSSLQLIFRLSNIMYMVFDDIRLKKESASISEQSVRLIVLYILRNVQRHTLYSPWEMYTLASDCPRVWIAGRQTPGQAGNLPNRQLKY